MKKLLIVAIATTACTLVSCNWFAKNNTLNKLTGQWHTDTIFNAHFDSLNPISLSLPFLDKKQGDTTKELNIANVLVSPNSYKWQISFNKNWEFVLVHDLDTVKSNFDIDDDHLNLFTKDQPVLYHIAFKTDSILQLTAPDSTIWQLKK